MSDVKSADWSYCPACGGGIDTGYECGKCGRDWLEWHQSRDVLRQEIERLTAIEQNYSHIGFEHAATVLSLRKAHDKTVQDLQSQLAQAQQERDRLQHIVEEQRATITYLEGLRHE